jgi:glycosyltransferase involved in cell wall biosynthesis
MVKISIIIPIYNQEKYICETIDCLLNQTFQDWECIIINDGSTDSTEEIVRKTIIGDSRFKYIFQQNKGLPGARNAGIKLSEGDYIVFLDSDDLLSNLMLQITSEYLDNNKEIAIVSGAWDYIDEKGRTISSKLGPAKSDDYRKDLLFENLFPIHVALLRKEVILKIGGFDESLISHEDWDFWLRAAFSGFKFSSIEPIVAHYRKHQNCMSLNNERMMLSSLQVFERIFASDTIGDYLKGKPYVNIQFLLVFANKVNEAGNPEKAGEIVEFSEAIFSKITLDHSVYPKYVYLLTGLPNSNKLLKEIFNSVTFQNKIYCRSISFIKQTKIALTQKKFVSAFLKGICSLIIWPPNIFIFLRGDRKTRLMFLF